MILFLFMIIVLLVGVIFFQYTIQKNKANTLRYIYKKLEDILEKQTSEKLLVATDDKEIQKLLVAINQLVESKQLINAEHTKVELSMRKMLSNVSHDLKTPLTVVLGYVEILHNDPMMSENERRAILKKLHIKTNEVMELIHKFFDLAKLESGDKEIELTRMNMNEVCQENILSFYDLLMSKGFSVQIDLPKENLYALGNVDVLSRVLNNLISNAITYGEDGKTLGLTLRADEKVVCIDIWDKGKGISQPHIDKVFERMYTLEDSRNRLYQGSGLGLTITKRLVQAIGGEIQLSSKPFEKTVFTIVLQRMIF